MSYQPTLALTPSATSLPESACGAMPCAMQDGPTRGRSGRAPAPASLSARQAKKAGRLTSGTYGQRSSISLRSADLSLSLGSRLQTKLESLGSTLYRLTWKQKATPQGFPFFQLVASAPHTSESVSTGVRKGWATPAAYDGSRGPIKGGLTDFQRVDKNGVRYGTSLVTEAQFANWPTPAARDWKDTTGMATTAINPDGSRRSRLDQLGRVVGLVGPARLTASGELLTGSSAETESGGQLNPAHSRWLMGLPPEWDDCAAMAMQ